MSDYKVTDDKQANWALRKLRGFKEERVEKEQQAKEYKEEIDDWLECEVSEADKSIAYFEGLLTEYAISLKEEDGELKTHKLPFGKLKFRKQRPKWSYDDELLLQAVEGAELDDIIKIKRSVSKSDLKKLVEVVNGKIVNKATGEIIEGVEVEERGEKFSIDY